MSCGIEEAKSGVALPPALLPLRDGTLARCEFIESVKEIRQKVQNLLLEAADYEIGSQEKTPLAKTVRTLSQLLKVEPAMWLFVTVEGVEPTNNAHR